MSSKNISMRDALHRALWEEMERDERVFVMGEEVGKWNGTHKVTRDMLDHFGVTCSTTSAPGE